MNKSILLFGLIILPVLLFSQEKQPQGRYQLVITEKGQGVVDTRVDNMGYWRKMVEQGMVVPDPVIPVPEAIYSGSGIDNTRAVTTTDSPDVPVTSVNSTQSENSIFIDPTDDLNVLNSNNSTINPYSAGGLYGADYLLSDDGGTTWGGSVSGAGGNNSGDPTTSISLSGRMYVGFINNSSGQSVSYSANGGSTWTAVVCGTATGGQPLDKNHMWIDNNPTSPYEGYVYSAWTDFGLANDPIRITRTVDTGLTYSSPVSISAGVSAGSHNQGVNIGTGPNGEVYVIWAIYDSWPSDEIGIGFSKSTNGGTSYTTATRIINNIKGIRTSGTGKNHRVNSFPSMAVDISGGPNDGNIYVVWANIGYPGVNTGSDIDVYMIKSTDDGATWSSPAKVNQDPSGLGKQHYFPWITCDPVSGFLSVIYYDDRNVSSSQCEVFCSNSYDGGTSWEDFKVSDVSFTPSPIPGLATGYMGDYLGISARNYKVYPVWADNRTSTVMTYCSPYELTPVPDAAFTASTTTPCLNDTVIITDQSNKTPSSWAWTITPGTFSYVNGSTASSQDPAVKFLANGNYTVQLIVGNAAGYDTLVISNYFSVNDANANFTASTTSTYINSPVTFTDLSSCNITSYSWNFGSGATPATANTIGPHEVSYSTTGLKTVALTVNGTVTETKTNYINVLSEPSYCAAGSSYTNCDEYISRVQIGSIDNSTGCSSPGGYGNYTALSTRVSPTYGYSITVSNGLPYSGDQCGIWVDWNYDGDFSDAGETITVSGTPGLGPYTATVTPPASAHKGNTRMRVRITYTGTVSSCGTTTYGEVEDYCVYVGTPGLWIGGAAGAPTDWNTAANWDDNRIPASTADIIIPNGLTYYPVTSGTLTCDDLTIRDNGSFTLQPGSNLTVNGNLAIGQAGSGTVNINASSVTVNGQITVNPGGAVNVTNGGTLTGN